MELKFILEVLLFSAQKALSPAELREALAAAAQEESESTGAFRRTKEPEITAALEELAAYYETAGRSYRLVCVAGAWQFVSKPDYAPWLRALVGHKARAPRLSQPALETLAIIAYRQPMTRSEIEQVRGVSVDGVMQTLLERGLVEATGRAEVVGRPMNYGTTPLFLEYFGLRNLEDLPAADELRRLPVERPAGLLTAEPGLATVPPSDLREAPEAADQAKPAQEGPRPTTETPATQDEPGATVT
jgi:segregation and condensation protein B